MRYLIFLAVVGFSGIAAALPKASLFNVTNFYVSGSPHSELVLYTFNVNDSSSTAAASCNGNISTGPYISSLSTTCCDTKCDWSFSFLLVENRSGYILNITNTRPGSGGLKDVGLKFFPESDIQMYNDTLNPNGDFQFLATDNNFTLVYCAEKTPTSGKIHDRQEM